MNQWSYFIFIILKVSAALDNVPISENTPIVILEDPNLIWFKNKSKEKLHHKLIIYFEKHKPDLDIQITRIFIDRICNIKVFNYFTAFMLFYESQTTFLNKKINNDNDNDIKIKIKTSKKIRNVIYHSKKILHQTKTVKLDNILCENIEVDNIEEVSHSQIKNSSFENIESQSFNYRNDGIENLNNEGGSIENIELQNINVENREVVNINPVSDNLNNIEFIESKSDLIDFKNEIIENKVVFDILNYYCCYVLIYNHSNLDFQIINDFIESDSGVCKINEEKINFSILTNKKIQETYFKNYTILTLSQKRPLLGMIKQKYNISSLEKYNDVIHLVLKYNLNEWIIFFLTNIKDQKHFNIEKIEKKLFEFLKKSFDFQKSVFINFKTKLNLTKLKIFIDIEYNFEYILERLRIHYYNNFKKNYMMIFGLFKTEERNFNRIKSMHEEEIDTFIKKEILKDMDFSIKEYVNKINLNVTFTINTDRIECGEVVQ